MSRLRHGRIWAGTLLIPLLLTCLTPASTAAETTPGIEDGQRAFDQHDYVAARRIWSDLAEAGDIEAAFRMGVLADFGGDAPPDPKAALDWYGRAADGGHPSAEFNVGVLLDSGLAGGRDAALAAIWYARAATHGNGRAMYNLAQLYAQGDGVPINPAMAAAWYRAAAAAHVPAAAARRDDPSNSPRSLNQSPSPSAPLLVTSCSAPCTGSAVPNATEPTIVELVWNAPLQVRSVRFFVEVMVRDDNSSKSGESPRSGPPRIVASRYEVLSATAVRLAPDARYAWRVYTVSTEIADYVIGPWNEFVIGPATEKAAVPTSTDALPLTRHRDN